MELMILLKNIYSNSNISKLRAEHIENSHQPQVLAVFTKSTPG